LWPNFGATGCKLSNFKKQSTSLDDTSFLDSGLVFQMYVSFVNQGHCIEMDLAEIGCSR
jgi:hypothetical protein